MAVDQRKRQKKLAKKKAKRKKQLQVTQRESFGAMVANLGQLSVAANSPIYQCLVPRELFEAGIGEVIISRKLANGAIAASFFLVDVFCLGVKDAFFRLVSRYEFADFVEGARAQQPFREIDPACARKLVEESVAYAQGLGLSPHSDYHKAKKIFGDIDAASCPASFTFGKDGQPFFFSGPNDTPARCQQIIETLTQSRGPNGFHFAMGIGGWGLFDEGELDEDDVEEEEGEED